MGKPAQGPSVIDDPDEDSLGPAMRELNASQRRFVIAALTFPHGKDWQIARAAGYSDRSNGSLRVYAHILFHNEKVLTAINEEASKRLRSQSILGASILARIAGTNGHKDQLKAAMAILDRTGFGAVQTMNVNKTVVDHSTKGIEERIARAMERLARLGDKPLEPVQSLPAVVEGEFSEVKDVEPE